ncbi:MAG: bacteriohopanetetrol glucosamine biosynthesis glycosyltransferase HpnI [Pseudomonadota bacterium]
MNSIFTMLGWAFCAVALIGAGYALLSAVLAERFMRRKSAAATHHPAVTILKPLHRDEPDLAQNLETVFNQSYPGAVQIVFGSDDPADPALGIVRMLQAKYPQADIAIVASAARHGANAKVSNLINMMTAARHDVLVLSDSDIAVKADWLTQVVSALQRPNVGVVSCLYTGEPASSGHRLWSGLAAMGTSYGFLPNAIVGFSLGMAAPCFGSTIALRRQTLDEVGGFEAFADKLADDYEIGHAVRRKGYALAIPALGVGHTAAENSFADLFRHELRWTRTIRLVNPGGHLGSIVTHGLPFALMGAVLLGFAPAALVILALVLATRLAVKWRMDGLFGTQAGPWYLLPVRDLLSFAVFLGSLFGETVHWRGSHFTVQRCGAISPGLSPRVPEV